LEAADQGDDVVILEDRATLLDDSAVGGTMPAVVRAYADVPRRWSVEEWANTFAEAIRITPARLVSWMTGPGSPPQRRTIRFGG
jgi:hypothetical protein